MLSAQSWLVTCLSVGGLEFTKWPRRPIKTSLTFHVNIIVTHLSVGFINGFETQHSRKETKISKRREECFVLLFSCKLFLARRLQK